MSTKTTHIVPSIGGWALRKEGDYRASSIRKKADRNGTGLYATQKQAIDAAREIIHHSSAGQIVVHGRDGSMHWRDVYGLPLVQRPPRKSDLGTKAIKNAVATVVRERLAGR